MSSTLSAAGLGQSTAVSIGGDAIIGSTYAELMPLFEADEQTQGIVIYTEPGGRMEAELARWVTEQQLAAADRGVHGGPLHGRDAGHELRARGHDRRRQGGHGRARRSRAWPQAGITVAERIEDIPGMIGEKIAERLRRSGARA